MLRNLSNRVSHGIFSSQNLRSYSTKIFYITDVEGSDVFYKSINKSKIVSCNPDTGINFINSGKQHFIFGGDATDRGNNDLTITEMLIDFKKRHPEEVTLLVGNREIKNNRFRIELNPIFIRERLLYSKVPRWLPESSVIKPFYHMKPIEYVIKSMSAAGITELDNFDLIKQYVETISLEDCQLIYLHWMLEKTMGCPLTFYFRREELAKQMKISRENISDSRVLQSFILESRPSGLMGKYLQYGQIGVIIPEARLLAVHGGLNDFNIGRTPDMGISEHRIEDAELWLARYNKWYNNQIIKWKKFDFSKLTQVACSELDESVLPFPKRPKYAVTADMLGPSREFVDVPDSVSDYLKKNKISVVFIGHQPQADIPSFLRTKSNNILFLNGDTGYAKAKPTNLHDTRGDVVNTVEVVADEQQTTIKVQGVLSDNSEAKMELTVNAEGISGDPYIGKLLPDNRLVQLKLENDNYRLVHQKGFEVTYSIEPAIKLDNKLNPNIPMNTNENKFKI